MHFVILGAGAIGCYVGGRLAAGACSVTLVGRPRMIEELSRTGLTVSDLDGFKSHLRPEQLTLATSLAAVQMDRSTVVVLCVKGGATESAALEIAACCPSGTSVVSLQNGVDNMARITAIAPRMSVIAGMVPYNVVMPNRSHAHRASAGHLHLARNPISVRMARLLEASGLPTALSDDMLPLQWGKLLLNLNNPVNALSGLPLRAQLMDPDYRLVLAALQLEALAVLRRAGVVPARVAAAPPRLLPYILRLPNWLFTPIAARLLHINTTARSSMADDLQHGRMTEIDDLCGAVVRLAAQNGCTAPRNAAMCKLVAAHRTGARLSGPELREVALC